MASGDSLIIFTPHAGEPTTANFATIDTRNEHPVLDFDAATNESAVFSAIMPRNYGNTNVTVYIHWALTSGTTGDVDWDVSWERIGDLTLDIDSDSFGGITSVNNVTAPTTSGMVDIVNLVSADLDGILVGEGCRMKLTRDAASDTASGDAEMLFVEVKET